jgi:hypothetical protein
MTVPNTYTWYFSWDNGNSVLELNNKTREQAYASAQYWGWRPSTWYRPSTWANFVIMG